MIVLKQRSYAKKIKSLNGKLEDHSFKPDTFDHVEIVARRFAQLSVLALKNNSNLNEKFLIT